MNLDPIIIVLGVLIRYGITIACALLVKIGLTEDEQKSLLSPEMIAYLTVALVAVGSGIYTRLKSKLKQKLALAMPANATEEKLDKAVKAQPLSAVLTAQPK